jgi:glyoxylase-like metal-dependent hydrolase (beta-lactamase superfamily II)
MNPTKAGPISGTNIVAVRNNLSDMYFVKTDSGYILIDAASDEKKFEISLKEARIDANDVRWIFLTHSDYDHVDALNLFPNAAVYMSEDELLLVNGTVRRNFFIGNNAMPEGFNVNKINLLSDGMELSCNGIKVKCIKTPGHTIGSMAYLIDSQYLFTGDAFKLTKGVMGVHPFTMDAKLAKKTMQQLNEIINKSSMVLTTHYGCR